jgi:hypothetical protein
MNPTPAQIAAKNALIDALARKFVREHLYPKPAPDKEIQAQRTNHVHLPAPGKAA